MPGLATMGEGRLIVMIMQALMSNAERGRLAALS